MDYTTDSGSTQQKFNNDEFNKLFQEKIIRDTKQSAQAEAEALSNMAITAKPQQLHERTISQVTFDASDHITEFLFDFFSLNTDTMRAKYLTGEKAVYVSVFLFIMFLLLWLLSQ